MCPRICITGLMKVVVLPLPVAPMIRPWAGAERLMSSSFFLWLYTAYMGIPSFFSSFSLVKRLWGNSSSFSLSFMKREFSSAPSMRWALLFSIRLEVLAVLLPKSIKRSATSAVSTTPVSQVVGLKNSPMPKASLKPSPAIMAAALSRIMPVMLPSIITDASAPSI